MAQAQLMSGFEPSCDSTTIDLNDDQDLKKEIRDAQKHFLAMDQWTKAHGLIHKDDTI